LNCFTLTIFFVGGTWVEEHRGEWNHGDWLMFVEELKQSEYWPLSLDAAGGILEELKEERRRRVQH